MIATFRSGLISADSHVIEPPDLFERRLDRAYRDRAPHVAKNDKGWVIYAIGENVDPVIVGVASSTGRLGLDMNEARRIGYEALRPSGWDPDARIKDQDVDGIKAEIIYPTIGRKLFGLRDAGLRRACFKAYNDWLAEFCGAHPKRLIGVALIDLEDIDEGVKEIERTARLGHRAAAIWEAPPEDKPYSSAAYDSLWAALTAHNMSASFHVGSGATQLARTVHAQGVNAASRLSTQVNVNIRLVSLQGTLQDVILGGILERHPTLTMVSVENNIGWVPYFLQALDHASEKYIGKGDVPLSMRPSDYARRQVFFTFESDRVGAASWALFGADNYLWASDFPHPAATWPNSRKVIAKDFEGVPAEVVHKITATNASRLYRLALD